MLHTKFRENRAAGSGEDFRRVFTIYGHGGHLGHVTRVMLINFHFLVPESFNTKFGLEWLSSFGEKLGLNFCMYTTLGQVQEMTLTFNTHIPSKSHLVVCIYQLSGHRLK